MKTPPIILGQSLKRAQFCVLMALAWPACPWGAAAQTATNLPADHPAEDLLGGQSETGSTTRRLAALLPLLTLFRWLKNAGEIADLFWFVFRLRVSAADASAAWDLRCLVREKLVEFLQRHHPGCLPRIRAEVFNDSPHSPRLPHE